MSNGATVVEQVDGSGMWRKPVVVNDWGHVNYYLKAIKSAWGTWDMLAQDPRQRIVGGDRLRVLWPDNSETEEVVVSKPYTDTVSDMGHTYDVKGERMVFATSVRGVRTTIPIEECWVQRVTR